MAGYIRQDVTNNIADGNVINASDFDNEYNAIEAAFHAATGHTHDGTAAEGAPITKIGPTQDVVASASALTPKTDNTVDLGSASFEFKDLYIDGTANIDSLVADTADINAGTIDGVTIGGASAGVGTFTTMNATTVDTSNIEVTTLKAKDGTAAGSIADSTGVVTLASSILTTTDINGGSIDGTAIGAASASTGAFTSLSASGTTTLSGLTASTALALNASKEVVSVTNTGTGNNVLATSPTLITPVLGSATATSINKVSITAPATSATFTLANGKTLTVNNSLTLNGTDATVMTFPSTSATVARSDAAQSFTGTQTFLSNPVLDAGTANGVLYLNASKVVTSGSALTFNGADLTSSGNLNAGSNITAGLVNGGTTPSLTRGVFVESSANNAVVGYSLGVWDGANNRRGSMFLDDANGLWGWDVTASSGVPNYVWRFTGSDAMRLDSTGLGIGTSSPNQRLGVQGNAIFSGGVGGSPFIAFSQDQAGGTPAYWQWSSSTGLSTFYTTNASSSNGSFKWMTGGSDKMLLDSSGNLGLGVTPSAWGAPAGIDIGAFAGFGQRSDNGWAVSAHNCYFDGTNWKYKATGIAPAYYGVGSGLHYWFTAPSGTAGNAISFTQAMTLDASGNLVVGTTSASARLDVVGGTGIRVNEDGASTKVIQVRSNFAGVGPAINVASNDPLLLQTNNTERARITSGGYFKASNAGTYLSSSGSYHELRTDNSTYVAYVTNTNASSPSGVVIDYSGAAPNGTGNLFLYCGDTGGERASIRSNGGLANYSGNDVNLSDRREKTNFAPAKSYLDTICAIPVQTFNYIDQSPDDPGLTLGVVAQDVQAVAPELVMESNWGTVDNPKMRLSVYQTDLQYALMKCIQEQQALIAALTARVAALETH